ncbi:hypothetical protein E8E11_011772 [Didymella keratinophila]|nr:hypothetical protein E8E11_011772 [Didymella keratinophila]
MGVFPFTFPAGLQQNVPAANQMQQFPAAAATLPDFEFSFPAAQQQSNLDPAPLLKGNAAQMQPHFNSPPPPTPLVPDNQVPGVLGTRGKLSTENGSERAKRRRIEETVDLTMPSPVPSPVPVPIMQEQMPMTSLMTPPSHESTAAAEDTAGPLSELLTFNAQTDWPSEEVKCSTRI